MSSVSQQSQARPNPVIINLEKTPSAVLTRANGEPTGPDILAHQEATVAELSSGRSPTSDSPTATTAAARPGPSSSANSDELPPLPDDIARPAVSNSELDTTSALPATSNSSVQSPGAFEAESRITDETTATSNSPVRSPKDGAELPPLPADIAHPTLPKFTPDAPGTVIATPSQVLVLPNLAPDASRTSTAAVNPAVTSSDDASSSAPSNTEEDTLPSRPSGNERLSFPFSAPRSSHRVDRDPTNAPLNKPTREPTISGSDSADADSSKSAPPEVKLSALAERGAAVTAAPTNPLDAATNPHFTAVPGSPLGPDNGHGTDLRASSIPPAIEDQGSTGPTSNSFSSDRPSSHSILGPDLEREVERIARNQEAESRSLSKNERQPGGALIDTTASDPRTQFQLDTSRAPSPAEARPIRAIPVPEDWVPLAPRNWSAQRKYWAAAATCHLPLYFQDPVLERYGHSVEQFVGPLGRYLTYPVDDPMQSTQRNQILQPFFSAGLFGLQIAAWPYNLIMDPPWEAQYDLGYYRPGDNIPIDTYWLPLHGYGPPLHGSRY